MVTLIYIIMIAIVFIYFFNNSCYFYNDSFLSLSLSLPLLPVIRPAEYKSPIIREIFICMFSL